MYKSIHHDLLGAESLSRVISNLTGYGNNYRNFCFFNSNENSSQYRFIAGLSNADNLTPLSELGKQPLWSFGYLAYDLKNEIEELHSDHEDHLHFQNSFFFVPDIIVSYDNRELSIQYLPHISSEEINALFAAVLDHREAPAMQTNPVTIKQRVSHSEYIATILDIKKHIQQGDIYEMNYCMEFFAEQVEADPAALYVRLNSISEAPFSSYARFGDLYVICSSPERFLEKRGERLITQPIKGTARRSHHYEEDELIKKELKESLKERTENVMIVDVARNDLSRIAEKGSVNVDELYGIYSFKQVHQMISTVSCAVKKGTPAEQIIRSTFPMASMTGAPKIRAMELIEELEKSRRGLYSGSLGYISPNGDFDLNVVIRTILYNRKEKYLSFSVGSAITISSDPEKEYEECLLKAKAMMQVLI